MKLSTKGRYAMVALADLALQPKGSLVNLTEISKRQDISLAYLEQLFVKLRRAELVDSVRGPGGGYRRRRNQAGRADRRPAASVPVRPVDRVERSTRRRFSAPADQPDRFPDAVC